MQVKKKLDSDEPIDYDYWEQLLRSLRIWKAKSKLRRVSQEIVKERLQALRKQQAEAAVTVQERLQQKLGSTSATTVEYDASLDPESALKLSTEDKTLKQVDEKKFLADTVSATPCQTACSTNNTRPTNGRGSRSLATFHRRTQLQTK